VDEIQQLYFGYGYLIGSLITVIIHFIILHFNHKDLIRKIKDL